MNGFSFDIDSVIKSLFGIIAIAVLVVFIFFSLALTVSHICEEYHKR